MAIRKRKDGRFEVRFTVDGVRHCVYAATRKECLAKEAERRAEIAAGAYTKNQTITLNQYYKEWIEQKAQSVKPATIYVYSSTYEHSIAPTLGARKVKDIERREVVALRTKLLKRLTSTGANYAVSLLYGILKAAMLDEIIIRNPCASLPGAKRKNNEPEARDTNHRALTHKEIEIFLKHAGRSWYYNAFRLMLATGMRAGECLALQWPDIDHKKNTIHIRRTITRTAPGALTVGTSTKTKRSNRHIPMNAEIAGILQDQRALYEQLHGSKVINLQALIFEGERGGPANAANLNAGIRAVLRSCKASGEEIDHFSSHAFRDTFATMAAAQGMPLNTLKEILGHSSYAMTADLYCHTLDEQKKEAMAAISIASK